MFWPYSHLEKEDKQGQRHARAPEFSKVGRGATGIVPPTFGQTKWSNLVIFSFFVVKNAKFSGLASLANFTLLVFSKLS